MLYAEPFNKVNNCPILTASIFRPAATRYLIIGAHDMNADIFAAKCYLIIAVLYFFDSFQDPGTCQVVCDHIWQVGRVLQGRHIHVKASKFVLSCVVCNLSDYKVDLQMHSIVTQICPKLLVVETLQVG